MKKSRADILRSGNPTNRDLTARSKLLEEIKTFEDVERFLERMAKRKATRRKESKHVDTNLPSKAAIIINSLSYTFEEGSEKGYQLETLARRRPEFLLTQVLNQVNRYDRKKYKLHEVVEQQVLGIIKSSNYFNKLLDSSFASWS